MKRAIIVVLAVAVAASAVSAQGWAPGFRGPGPGAYAAPAAPAETVKIEGKLALVNAHPAVVVKDKTYYVGIPGRLFGFVDGLKEGAQVKLEGYEQPLPYATNVAMFHVVKLTVGGREIDLSQSFGYGRGMMGAYGPAGDYGPMGRGMMPGGRGRW
ncbi:MAG TPA: hypothetical protein P5117_13885 [Spirochaetia bacterium]|nr:hypothetical protein [Spirochaetales bacterium]HRY81010.1 hypothetical protein [Spirochaetia bacterium]HRZ90567.1 hypothetical protein [Spirochaetia bacterium]